MPKMQKNLFSHAVTHERGELGDLHASALDSLKTSLESGAMTAEVNNGTVHFSGKMGDGKTFSFDAPLNQLNSEIKAILYPEKKRSADASVTTNAQETKIASISIPEELRTLVSNANNLKTSYSPTKINIAEVQTKLGLS